jgi:hypothetical protein
MTEQRLLYVYKERDRHGNVRVYFWRGKGHRKVRILEAFDSPEFHKRYAALLEGRDEPAVNKPRPDPVKAQTFRWLVVRFFASAEFIQIGRQNQITQNVTLSTLEACCQEPISPGSDKTFADLPLDQVDIKALEILRDRKGAKEGLFSAANTRVIKLRQLFKWGKKERLVASNVAAELERIAVKSEGYHTWTVEELERYERHHPVGTPARLALDLMQYLGLSRMDVVVAGPRNIKDGTYVARLELMGR